VKKASGLSLMFVLGFVVPSLYAAGSLVASKGNSVTLSAMDFGSKNDHNVTAPSFSKASFNLSDKTIKARAYVSTVPTSSSQKAAARIGSRISLSGGTMDRAWVKITFNGSYNGLIGALGVAAGRVLLTASIDTSTNLVYDQVNSKVILDTSAGGLPSGPISSTFITSFNTCLPRGHVYNPVIELDLAAGVGMKVVGVVDNDFYESGRRVKLDSIKIEVLDSCASQAGGNSGMPQGQGPGGGKTIIPK
jgi:hypothetical protein